MKYSSFSDTKSNRWEKRWKMAVLTSSIRSKNGKMSIRPRKYIQWFHIRSIPFIWWFFYFSSDGETLTHLLKASLGTGILSMPFAFKASGLALGVFATILTAIVCTHCSYVLVSDRWFNVPKTRKKKSKINTWTVFVSFSFSTGEMCSHIIQTYTTNWNEFCWSGRSGIRQRTAMGT